MESLPRILAAPLAGGASNPGLVIAAAQAGRLGFLAGGYQTPEALGAQMATVRRAGVPFGVNLFVPNPLPVDPSEFRRYARALQPEADPYGLTLDGDDPIEDDDGWHDKLDILAAHPPDVISLTFGIPDRAAMSALLATGAIIVQSVTSAEEAAAAEDAGADVVAVQASVAGGHSATLTPREPPAAIPLVDLVAQVGRVTSMPIVAAGGISTPGDVSAVIAAGADAAMAGTALLLADEAGTSAAHRAALADPARTETVITKAFTGRPARGLRTTFIDRHESEAPFGYPAIHHLTSPLRKAAAAAGDADRVHLWAGTGYRAARPGPAADILSALGDGA